MNLKCFQFYAELISDVSVYYLYTYKVKNCLPKVDNRSNHVSQHCKLSRLFEANLNIDSTITEKI